MRETRPSGSMRGRHQTVIGHVPLIPVVSPYSTKQVLNSVDCFSNHTFVAIVRNN